MISALRYWWATAVCAVRGHQWEKDERNRYGTALASRPIEECVRCWREKP